jgi:S1-C subfamily serine protease
VVTDVAPATPASDAGLRRGDIIEEINRQSVTNVAFSRNPWFSAVQTCIVWIAKVVTRQTDSGSGVPVDAQSRRFEF